MNKDFRQNELKHFFDQSTIRILYYKHKAFIPSAIALFISFVLLFTVVIPQADYVFSLDSRVKDSQKKIGVFKQNISFLSSLNESELDSKLKIVVAALPPEKDFIGIMSAISQASSVAGVSVGDFSFQLGRISESLAGTSGTKSISADGKPVVQSTPSVQMQLSVTGGVNSAKSFINELSKNFPISDVSSVQINDKSSLVTVSFFYRAFPSVSLDGTVVLSPLSQKDVSLIDSISSSVSQ